MWDEEADSEGHEERCPSPGCVYVGDGGAGGCEEADSDEEKERSSAGEAAQLDALFGELWHECRRSAPGARLSARLRAALERLRPERRRALVSRTQAGASPLFVAAQRGNAEVCEYLARVCHAPLEQRCVYHVPEERARHAVTALWAAAVGGRLAAVRALAAAGADVDAPSDSGSTPVRSACFMTYEHVVHFLLSVGADVHRPNHNGGTCLINAVQSPSLCRLLLQHGARVDAHDMQHKTALHYAAQEHRAETAALLLRHGADPRRATRHGDTALRTACVRGAAAVAALLLRHAAWSRAERADAHELLGATHLDEFNDAAAARREWAYATRLREGRRDGRYVEKLPARAPPPPLALGGAREWRTSRELDALLDVDALRAQALLVVYRILGPDHKDTVFRLMYRGAAYTEALRHARCVELWTWALHLRLLKDTLLYSETCACACALTRLLLEVQQGERGAGAGVAGGAGDGGAGALVVRGDANARPGYDHVLAIYNLMLDYLPEAGRLAAVRPQHRRQLDTLDRALRCALHLLHLLLLTAHTEQQRHQVEACARRLVAGGVASPRAGDSALHLAVSRLCSLRGDARVPAAPAAPFPSAAVARLLLRAGADVMAQNRARSTPLHLAAIPYNYDNEEVVDLLLSAGAHLDAVNKFGDSPLSLLRGAALGAGGAGAAGRARARAAPAGRHVALACLAARALAREPRARLPALLALLPRHLRAWLLLHRADHPGDQDHDHDDSYTLQY